MSNFQNKRIGGIIEATRARTGWFLLWIFWPFAGLLRALYKYRHKQAKFGFWLFCVFFGFTFVFDYTRGVDSISYALALVEMHEQSLSFSQLFSMLYAPHIGYVDVYQPLLTWVVALFTDDPRWLYALFGGVFGVFYARNIWMVLDQLERKMDLILLLFLLAFALTNPIWNINGVRMWTAAQIFLYGNLLYFLKDDKKGLWWSASSILVHFSFMFPVALLFLYIIIPKKMVVFFGFYIGAAFIQEIDLAAVREFLSFLPEVFQPRIESYTSEEYALTREGRDDFRSWHVVFAGQARRWIIYAWAVAIFIFRRSWLSRVPKGKELFQFALFLGGWAHLASMVPSGGRFFVVANAFFFLVVILILSKQIRPPKAVKISRLMSPFLLFSLAFSLRLGLDYFGAFAVFGNPLSAIMADDQTTFMTFIRGLL